MSVPMDVSSLEVTYGLDFAINHCSRRCPFGERWLTLLQEHLCLPVEQKERK